MPESPSPKPQGWDYVIILTVFAFTGTTAAFAPRFLMPLTGLDSGFWYWVVYFVLITPVYQVLLLMYAFLFGKFSYFYEKEKMVFTWIGRKLGLVKATEEG
ncbi:MAG: hypothetical protein NWR72_11845 [Bacteroidia bacterium]|nr:hypothetical protein [Bacteroidia bacterium]